MNYIYTEHFIAGEGNQLFVYFYGMIFSNKFNIPYIHPGISSMKIPSTIHLKPNNRCSTKKIVNYIEELEREIIQTNINFILDYGYSPTIENYLIFKPHINFLKDIVGESINPIVEKDDLVYHFRCGDNIMTKNSIYYDSIKLENLLTSIKYNKLYVVTNLFKHDELTNSDLSNYKTKLLKFGDCGAKYSNNNLIQPQNYNDILNKVNGIINVLKKYNAIWISNSIYEDFKFIQSFNNIIVGISTFSWWAAALSNAENVYVSQNWKFLKGNMNKNLPFADFKGWVTVDL